MLVFVAVPTVITIFDNANSPDPEGALQVDVVGEQWWWEFNYPDPTDPDNTLVTANELHIPVNEVVNLTLDSKGRAPQLLDPEDRGQGRPCTK